MHFDPKPPAEIEKERAAQGVWPAGEYPFEVLEKAMIGQYESYTEERKSKSGNDMIQLVLSVKHPTGAKRVLRDWLVTEMAVKLHDASWACGLGTAYSTGKLEASNFIGKRGTLKLGIEKDKEGKYDDRNAVKGYVLGTGAVQDAYAPDPAPVAPAVSKDDIEDEIPF